jgi:phage terminase large subunit-like protein
MEGSMNDEAKSHWKAFTEEVEVAGHQLVDEVNRLLAEGNVRKLEIRSEEGDVYLSVPLTAGAVAGGVMALAAPWLAVIAALAGLLTRVRLEIVRAEPAAKPEPDKDNPSGN